MSLKKVMKNLDEYKRRWRAIENLTGLHVVSSSVHIKQEMVSTECGAFSITDFKQEMNYTSTEPMEQEVSHTSGESFEDGDTDTMSEYSVASSKLFYIGSTQSMDHPYHHQKLQQQHRMRLKNMKHSTSDGKLPSASSFHLKANMGTYQRIEEDLEESDNNTMPKVNSSPNIKRRLFRKSNKGN